MLRFMTEKESKKALYDTPNRSDFPLIGLRFLIIDDVRATRNVLRRILFSLNVEFENLLAVNSLEEAYVSLGTEDFDVILCDLNLSDGKGLELLQFIREHPDLKYTPFVMITNDPIRDELQKARELGVSSILLKPLSIDNVSEHVSKAILSGN
jgi:CheY-like chemotaxis protein